MARNRRTDPVEILGRLVGVPEMIRALTTDMTKANDELEAQVLRTRALLGGQVVAAPVLQVHAPAPTIPPAGQVHAPDPRAPALRPAPTPEQRAAEALAVREAEAQLAMRSGHVQPPAPPPAPAPAPRPQRVLSPQEQAQRDYLAEKKPEKDALVASMRGAPRANGSGAAYEDGGDE